MLTSNYHTHTKRCGHAIGEDQEYVEEAIACKYQILGFSDHIMLPNVKEEHIRGDYSLLDDYVTSIRELQERYKEKIDIYLGFEAESFPEYFNYYKELLDTSIVDYLILGNHNIMSDDSKIVFDFANISSASQLYTYRDLALKALNSGLFSIFAHPDYFMYNIDQFDSDCKRVSKDIIETCVKLDIPLEVNVGGFRKGRRYFKKDYRYVYPTDDFFSIVKRYKAKCIIGVDAHSPEDLKDEESIYKAVKFCKDHDLEMIQDIKKIKHI